MNEIKNNNFKKNKKGWIRMIESFIAILFLAGVIIFIVGNVSSDRRNSFSEIAEISKGILGEIQTNESLRQEIIDTQGNINWTDENFPILTKEKIGEKTPLWLSCEANICSISENCLLTEQRKDEIGKKDIYSDSVMIFSTLTTHNPRIIKLFCFR